MKTICIGSVLDEPDYLAFNVCAASQHKSKAALIRELVLDYLKKASADKAESRSEAKTGEAES